ncbi:hypothetical protein BASA61_007999 [Batrachochytrium salamandrivorans]|nr:hypothetical protein BASA61_007999 [Batrachochytrium salamandrivorans]
MYATVSHLIVVDPGVIVSKEDVKREFTYTAIKLPNENPYDGFSTILSPENFQASPNGWTDGFELKGNNAEAKYKKGKTFGTSTRGIWRFNYHKRTKQQEKNGVSFDTLPDGHPGVLNLHIFTATEPNRDPALDNNAMIHEPEDTRNTEKVIAEYVKDTPRGVRKYPYTTNMDVNPLTYKDAIGEKNPYRLGEIWATMLWEVYWNFVEKYGFSANLHDATQSEGNIIFLQLFVGTLMIQPCDPTFDSACDAILAADDAYYGGIHKHLIIKGFAKRGFGPVSQLDPTMDNAV